MKKNILELGCGEGYNAGYLSKAADNIVTGIDLFEENINYAKKHFPRAKFLQMSAEDLNFPNGNFDTIYAMDVLEHVDDLPKTLDEISRVIKKGGKLIINVPAEKSERWLLSLRPSYFKEIHHVRIFTGNQMQQLLEAKGFTMVKKNRTNFLSHIHLYYLFKHSPRIDTQLSVGNLRANWIAKLLFAATLYCSPRVFRSWLRYLPFWVIGIPFGWVISSVGNRYMPKSIYYEFVKG